MEKLIDLHTHSSCSDGSMTPSELITHAKNEGLSAVALTDHDCTTGLKEAAAKALSLGIEFVPGVEFSVNSDAESHIVGLFIDPDCPDIASALEKAREERLEKNFEVSQNLKKAGMDVSLDEARKFAGGALLCRAHFAKAMVEKGYVASVKEAFDLYLAPGKCGYSPTVAMSAQKAISVIKKSGGAAFLAHVHHTKKEGAELEAYLKELKSYGLDGIEGYYSEYTPSQGESYRALAKKLGLQLSGGSDFHGRMKPHIKIGRGFGEMRIPYFLLEKIKILTNR